MQRLILTEVVKNDQMLALMGLLGIGQINAFSLVATIGDVRRVSCAKKLAAYLGLNPGSRDSGTNAIALLFTMMAKKSFVIELLIPMKCRTRLSILNMHD